MALATRLADFAKNASANAVCAGMDGGFLRIYDGTQPSDPDNAITTQVLLAEIALPSPAFADAVAGVATANVIPDDLSANATGTATWYRVVRSDGVTKVLDGSVGTTAAFDLVLSDTSIVIGGVVRIGSFTYTQPQS